MARWSICRGVRAGVDLPVLRKDFIVDEYQLFEARAIGADAVLLIVAALAQPRLVELQRKAWELGLATLVEVHDEEEMTRAIDSGARVIGVNNRNLRTLEVGVDASHQLAAMIPKAVVGVSESGLKTRDDLLRLGRGRLSRVPDRRAIHDRRTIQRWLFGS